MVLPPKKPLSSSQAWIPLETTLQCVINTLIHDCALAASAGRVPKFFGSEVLKPDQEFTITPQLKQGSECNYYTI